MEILGFDSDYQANLLEKLSLENKTLVLLGDLFILSSSTHCQPNSYYSKISNAQ